MPKNHLADLVRDTDANLTLEDEVEERMLGYVDEFVDRVMKGACSIAKHRQVNTVEVKDVQQFISKLILVHILCQILIFFFQIVIIALGLQALELMSSSRTSEI